MDNNLVKKVPTFKAGNFVLSRKCNEGELSPLLMQSRILYETVRDLPILPELSAQLEEELIRRSIFGTAALEGNPLTEERVEQIIAEPAGNQKMGRAEKEIRNLKAAYDLFARGRQVPVSVFKFDEDHIREIHSLVTHDIEHEYNLPSADGSPAAQAGLQAGDVIVGIGGKDVADVEALTQVLYTSKIGQPLEIVFWRGNDKNTIQVIPAESPVTS